MGKFYDRILEPCFLNVKNPNVLVLPQNFEFFVLNFLFLHLKNPNYEEGGICSRLMRLGLLDMINLYESEK